MSQPASKLAAGNSAHNYPLVWGGLRRKRSVCGWRFESLGHSHQSGEGIGLHFLHCLAAMSLYGNFTQPQFRSNLLVQQAGYNQVKNLPLARGEPFKARLQERDFGLLCTPNPVAVQRLMDGGEQVLLLKWLGKKFHGSRFHRSQGHRNIAVGGNKDDRDADTRFLQLILKVETCNSGQPYIEHQTAGNLCPTVRKKLVGRPESSGFEAYGFEQSPYGVSHRGVVVDNKNYGSGIRGHKFLGDQGPRFAD